MKDYGYVLLIGIFIGVLLMSIITRVGNESYPEYYGDKCLNNKEYKIDTIYTYSNNKLINIEYKFVKK